jgi:hypothetical protein
MPNRKMPASDSKIGLVFDFEEVVEVGGNLHFHYVAEDGAGWFLEIVFFVFNVRMSLNINGKM